MAWSAKMRQVWTNIQLDRARKLGCSYLSPHQLRRLQDRIGKKRKR